MRVAYSFANTKLSYTFKYISIKHTITFLFVYWTLWSMIRQAAFFAYCGNFMVDDGMHFRTLLVTLIISLVGFARRIATIFALM